MLVDCPEEGSSNSGLGNIVHCSLGVRVDFKINTIPVPPITAGRAKTTGLAIWGAVRSYKIIRGAHKKGNKKR